jgi:flagellar hook-basal body complex protein FliE
MSPINVITSIAASSQSPSDPLSRLNPQTAAPFSGLFHDAVDQMNAVEGEARTAVEGLMKGSGVDVHEAMIATQKMEMAFELALAVHNKAIQAYQSVIGMQF